MICLIICIAWELVYYKLCFQEFALYFLSLYPQSTVSHLQLLVVKIPFDKDKIMEILVGTLPLDQTACCTSKQWVFKPTSIHTTKQLHTRQKGGYVFPALMLNATGKKQMHLLHYLKKQSKGYRDRCRPACWNKCFCYKADRVLLHRSLLLTPAAKITPVRIKKSPYSKSREPEQC